VLLNGCCSLQAQLLGSKRRPPLPPALLNPEWPADTRHVAAAHTRAKEAQAHQGSDYGSSSRTRNAELRALWGESGAGPLQAGPSSADEPIRWNRVRRRSSSRAVRPTVESAAPEEDEVIICPPPGEAKYQQAAECSRFEPPFVL
jgi:hypothetical protein